MADIPIELFLGFIGISFVLIAIGLIRKPMIPALIVFAGMFILSISMITDNIVMGYSESAERMVSIQELYHLHSWNADRDLFGAGNTIRAMHATAGSSLISTDFFDRVDCMQLFIKKTGAPVGNADIGVFNTNQVLIFTFGTIDVSTLTTSYVLYNFCPAVELHHFIDVNSYMGIRYTGGDTANKIFVAVDTTNPIGDNILVSRFAGASWVDEPAVDLAGVLYNRAEIIDNVIEPNIYEFTEMPKVMFAFFSVVLMLVGALITKMEN